ncbi:unnamed protein product, partial [Porites evermanni]
PENCVDIKATKVNPEIWNQLNPNKRKVDLQLSKMQQVVRKGTFATLQTTNVLLQNASGLTNSNLIAQSVDVVALLGHVNTQLAQFRREQIKPALKQEYSTICSAEVPLTSQYLFGDELAKQLRDARESSKITHSVNPKIWNQLNPNKRKVDLQLSKMQQVVREGTFATLQTTNVLLQNASGLTNSNLIAQSVDVVALLGHMLKQEPINLKERRGPTSVTKSSRGSTPSLAQTEPPSLSLIRESLGKYNLSSSAKDVLMASWREGTSKQYHTYLKRWRQYCDDKDIDLFQPGVHNGVEFLVSLYKAGLGYSAVNTARSALSSPLILENNEEFGDHPLVVRGMKGIFELKPSLPKYNEIWDVRVVLDYLKTFGASIALLLKELTLKLTMLLCLTTGQRGQTIHKFDINDIQDLDDRYRISVHEKLKQTKLGRHLEPIELLAFPENKELCVVQHLREYIHLTDPLRKDHSQLLLSYVKPFKPVARDTVS